MDGKCKLHGETKYLYVKSARAKLCFMCVQDGLYIPEIEAELYAQYPEYKPVEEEFKNIQSQTIKNNVRHLRAVMRIMLSRCTEDQRGIFRKMYKSVNNIPPEKMDWAFKQIETTLKENHE